MIRHRRVIATSQHAVAMQQRGTIRRGPTSKQSGKPTQHAFLNRSRRYEFVEPQATILRRSSLFRAEIAIRVDLLVQLVLLDAARVARRLGRALCVFADFVVEVVGHAQHTKERRRDWFKTDHANRVLLFIVDDFERGVVRERVCPRKSQMCTSAVVAPNLWDPLAQAASDPSAVEAKLPLAQSYSRPISMSSEDLDSEMAISDCFAAT